MPARLRRGTLTYNGDDDTYTVALTLDEGGSGTVQFTGLLDHGPRVSTAVSKRAAGLGRRCSASELFSRAHWQESSH